MDIYKQKFTKMQQEILRFLFMRAGESLTQRAIASALEVSPTAVSKALPRLVGEKLVTVAKDPGTKRLSIGLDRKAPRAFHLKRVENLRLAYESGLVDYLSERFPGSTIVLFGSYSRGEDTVQSDIDIAIIGSKEKETELDDFESLLGRTINLNAYESTKGIPQKLMMNLCNGIVLEGAL